MQPAACLVRDWSSTLSNQCLGKAAQLSGNAATPLMLWTIRRMRPACTMSDAGCPVKGKSCELLAPPGSLSQHPYRMATQANTLTSYSLCSRALTCAHCDLKTVSSRVSPVDELHTA